MEGFSSDFDCIVIGAGIIGCSAAYQLAKKGCQTLLLEQFPLPHTRGSSHGQTRVLRFAHPQAILVEMMKESLQMWQQLEREAQTQIYRETGMLLIDLESSPLENNVWDKAYADLNIPHEILTSRQMCTRYGGIEFHDNYKATFEKLAGTLAAEKALTCYQNLFKKYGGKIQDREKVMKIIPGKRVHVKTNKGWYAAKQLVLTPGPWASQLLHQLGINLPLTVEKVNACFWEEKVPSTFGGFPAFVDVCIKSSSVYGQVHGLPMVGSEGMLQICLHHGADQAIVDPDGRDKPENCKEEDIDVLSKYIREHFPGLEDRPCIIEPCLYTSTPDYFPVIDKHPVFPNITFACGMSGTGFKFAPVYGKIVAQLTLEEQVDYDLTAFRHNRFKPNEGSMSKL